MLLERPFFTVTAAQNFRSISLYKEERKQNIKVGGTTEREDGCKSRSIEEREDSHKRTT